MWSETERERGMRRWSTVGPVSERSPSGRTRESASSGRSSGTVNLGTHGAFAKDLADDFGEVHRPILGRETENGKRAVSIRFPFPVFRFRSSDAMVPRRA
jgi:hypothetical protein